MDEVVVVSGKGGTGKTTLVAYLASAIPDVITADCDVDAPNLHLLLRPNVLHREGFVGMKKAYIDVTKCTNCGKCASACRFGAARMIGIMDIRKAAIDEGCCEGCALCSRICPTKAIRMVDKRVGEWYVSDTEFGKMVHAQLDPGADNSGKLVAMVKQKARMIAKDQGAGTVLVDGPPGIGCPVISSLSGCSLAVIVSEPTESGLSDVRRVLDLAKGFQLKTGFVTNKADLNAQITLRMEKHARGAGARVLGRIPYDEVLANTMARGNAARDDMASPATRAMAEIHRGITGMIDDH
jgi:MinD superfamily P-loop ATPase